MDIASATAPSLADFERIAEAAFAGLPQAFRTPCASLLIRVSDFADEATLTEMGIENSFELTGLYDGVALTEQSVMDVRTQPETVWLFRRPILNEWAERSGVALDRLVAHVLVHEIAHHFGYSDEAIAEIDDWRL